MFRIVSTNNYFQGEDTMELNIKKQSVCVNELSFNQNAEQGIDFTVNIPEYCGKVERLLKYNLIPRINSKVLNGQTLTIEGAAYFSLIFASSFLISS